MKMYFIFDMYRQVNVKNGVLVIITSCFVSFSFEFVIQNATQELQGEINTIEAITNKSGVRHETMAIIISTRETSSTASSKDPEGLEDLETKKENNTDHVREKLNHDDLYGYITDKNNVSQRSLVFKPSSKYRIPLLYNQPALLHKTRLSTYEKKKTFYTDIDDFDIESIDSFVQKYDKSYNEKSYPFMNMVRDENLNHGVYVSNTTLHNSKSGSPIKKVMHHLTNKVKVANGIIHMQYNNVNNNLLQIERQFPGRKSDKEKGYFNYLGLNQFQISKPHKNTEDQINNVADNTQDYVTNCLRNIDGKDTKSNTNGVNFKEDQYDYVELVKHTLVRPGDKQKLDYMKKTLYDRLKQRYTNDIALHSIDSKLKDSKVTTVNRLKELYNQIENNGPMKHREFYPEDNQEPEFHYSELAEKVQEMRELSKQFSDEITLIKKIDRRRGMKKKKHVNNSTQHQINRNVAKNSRHNMMSRVSCVYPDCEFHQ